MKKVLKQIWSVIFRFIKNKYLFSLVFFIVWITIFDTYNLLERTKRINELKKLRQEKEFFKQEIATYKRQTTELFSNKENLEKFAREQYMMKKENEDIFIVINEED